MSSGRKRITAQELRKMIPWLSAANAVYFALLLVIFFMCGYDYTLLLGGVWGNAVGIGNFLLMGISAEKAVRRSAKSAQNYMNTVYCLRYLGVFFAMTAAGVLPFLSLPAAVIPLFFPRLAVTITGLLAVKK